LDGFVAILQGNSGRSTAAENRKRNMVTVVVVWDSRAKGVEGVLDLGRSDPLSAPGTTGLQILIARSVGVPPSARGISRRVLNSSSVIIFSGTRYTVGRLAKMHSKEGLEWDL
jgi:hypothetical protein